MPLSMSTQIVRVSGLMSTPLEGEIVILNVKTGAYVALDTIGHEIWNMLATPHDVAAICERLVEQFEGTREDITRDATQFIKELLAEDLVQVVR